MESNSAITAAVKTEEHLLIFGKKKCEKLRIFMVSESLTSLQMKSVEVILFNCSIRLPIYTSLFNYSLIFSNFLTNKK